MCSAIAVTVEFERARASGSRSALGAARRDARRDARRATLGATRRVWQSARGLGKRGMSVFSSQRAQSSAKGRSRARAGPETPSRPGRAARARGSPRANRGSGVSGARGGGRGGNPRRLARRVDCQSRRAPPRRVRQDLAFSFTSSQEPQRSSYLLLLMLAMQCCYCAHRYFTRSHRSCASLGASKIRAST